MRFGRLHRDERGMSLVFVALGFMGFFAATMLAIDVGMLMTARSQAQNSADAGALAGAVALAFVDYTDHSPTGPAVTGAITQATSNKVMAQNVSVTAPDVEFLQDPTGEWDRVRVTVYRNQARGNPLSTIIASLFGITTANISAVATAEASPADMPARCFPFTIPDKWRELTAPPFNSYTSTFDKYDNHNNLLNPHDVYVPADQTGYTGYSSTLDKGSLVILKASNGTKVAPSEYNPITIGSTTGASAYEANILSGKCSDLRWNQMMVPEPGNMVGPTVQGISQLIDKTSDAYWDTACNCPKGSTESLALRIGAIPLYDPDYYVSGKMEGRFADFKAANFLGVFIVGMQGNDVVARITPMAGNRSETGPYPITSFPKAIRLIR